MIIEQNERVIPVDIDDTLVMHDYEAYPNCEWVEIDCPYTKEIITVAVNQAMVRVVQEEYVRGSCLIGWSSGGYKWAKAVIEALKITECFSFILTKPTAYLDDSDAANWMGRRLWLDPKKPYKQVAPRVNID